MSGLDRHIVRDGSHHVLRRHRGAQWDELPERYGKWKSVHKRLARWAKNGVWERVFRALINDPKNAYVMLDATLVRAHQQAATGKGGGKKGAQTRLWGVPELD